MEPALSALARAAHGNAISMRMQQPNVVNQAKATLGGDLVGRES